jgi:hypothetical protein
MLLCISLYFVTWPLQGDRTPQNHSREIFSFRYESSDCEGGQRWRPGDGVRSARCMTAHSLTTQEIVQYRFPSSPAPATSLAVICGYRIVRDLARSGRGTRDNSVDYLSPSRIFLLLWALLDTSLPKLVVLFCVKVTEIRCNRKT